MLSQFFTVFSYVGLVLPTVLLLSFTVFMVSNFKYKAPRYFWRQIVDQVRERELYKVHIQLGIIAWSFLALQREHHRKILTHLANAWHSFLKGGTNQDYWLVNTFFYSIYAYWINLLNGALFLTLYWAYTKTWLMGLFQMGLAFFGIVMALVFGEHIIYFVSTPKKSRLPLRSRWGRYNR